ncbi:MAG TPA: hypothetical protein VK622_12320 [Puia sp.]|nr:hypothetical protein [Puia sp.]
MKKNYVIMVAVCMINLIQTVKGQIQKGNVMMGADIASLNLSLNTGSNFSAELNPKAAWFIENNIALGAFVNFGISTSKGNGTSVSYGIGPLARYYINDPNMNPVQHARFFFEGTVGIQGNNPAVGESTNGLGLGFGPGLAYFITPTVGLEALLKYEGIVGFGSSVTSSNLVAAFGFQIYLPGKTVEKAARMKQ